MEGSEVLKNAELRRKETRFLPMITQGIRKYYSIEEMSKIEKPQPSLEDVQNRERSSFDQVSQPQPLLDDVPSQPQPPLDLVTLHPQPPLDLVTLHPQPPLDLVTLHPQPLPDHVSDERKPRKALIPLAAYIMLIKDEQKKSRQALYRDFHSGKLGLPAEVLYNGKKRNFFVEVNDPKIMERAMMLEREKEILKMLEKRLSYIYIQVPLNMSQEVDLISSPDNPSYKRFHEFISQSSGVVLRIKTNSNHMPCIKRRIKIRKEDYQKVLEIAKANDLSVGKVIVAFLKSYFQVE